MIDKFIFEKIDGIVTLIKYTGDETSIVIPDFYEGEPVVAIGSNVIHNESKIIKIKLPNTIEIIKSEAFSNCHEIIKIKLPEKLRIIEKLAFFGCINLSEIILPKSVEVIGDKCFTYCYLLKKVVAHNKKIKVGKDIFTFCREITTIDIHLIKSLGIENMISATLNYIEQWATLTKDQKKDVIKLINNKKTLKRELLLCDDFNLITFLIDNKIKITINDIDEYLEYHIKSNNTSIVAVLLDYKEKNFTKEQLNEIKRHKELVEIGLEKIDYTNLRKLWTCSKKDGIIRISGYKGKEKFATIPSSVSDGTKIEKLIHSKDNYYFPISTLNLEEGITHLNEKCFIDSCSLQNINLPKSIKRIEKQAFMNCDNLIEIEIPENVEFIGTEAFFNCKRLKSVKISANINRIYGSTFGYCSELEDVILPDTIEYISNNAFNHCTSLKEITIPKSVKVMEELSFLGCFSLKKVIFLGDIIESSFFDYIKCELIKKG